MGKSSNIPNKTGSTFLKQLMGRILPSHSDFVFELFMENKVNPFYSNTIHNTLTNNKFSVATSDNKTTVSSNIFIVHNVPDYLDVKIIEKELHKKIKKVVQYEGFLVNLTNYTDVNNYLIDTLSKRNKKNLFAKQKKLLENNQISCESHFGGISKAHYDFLFDTFYRLLESRSIEKKMYNKNLAKWKYYHELVYPMILDKKASLFVIYDNEKPITITLNFHLNDTIFSYIEGYDTAYSNFNMGDISMLKNIEWCINNGVSIYDLSIGETYSKTKWCNHTYNFKHHIHYNSKSVLSLFSAYAIEKKLSFKQFLRNKDIIGKIFQYDKFFYKKQMKKLKDYKWQDA